MRKIPFLVSLLACGLTTSALAQELAGDWIGQLSGGFKIRIHFDKSGSGFSGKLTNPSGNETVLDRVTSDGTHLHFAVNKLDLSYDGVWNEKDKLWVGNLTFQQVYPLALKRATAEDLAPAVRRRPQEDAISAKPLSYLNRDVHFGNTAGHNQLAGTLSVPDGKGPFPAVVLISGTTETRTFGVTRSSWFWLMC